MKADIDLKMKEQNLDALWVMGAMKHNADMVYFTGIHEVKQVDLFKRVGNPPIVYHFVDMERDEAKKCGLEVHSLDAEKPLDKYFKAHQGDLGKAVANRLKDVMTELGLHKGRIAISGSTNIQWALCIIEHLKSLLPDVEFVTILRNSPIQQARRTKEEEEVNHVRQMGQITTEVVNRVADFLTSQRVKENRLVDNEGIPIKISDIKSRINLWIAELGAENPQETIFAIGREAGIPHSTGNPDAILELGKPIVFDIFPCEKGGGYFYDFTRTWCIGYASEETARLHAQVLKVHHKILDELEPNVPLKTYQSRACKLFSEMEHKTIAEQSPLDEGYVHSISHGIGLDIHENPFSGITATEQDLLEPGVVFSIEPGLYYPSKEIGIRIEDTAYLNPDGHVEILADYPYDLVLPIKNR